MLSLRVFFSTRRFRLIGIRASGCAALRDRLAKTSEPVMAIEFRPTKADDLPEIARVVVETWRSTFTGLLPAEFLDSLSRDDQERRHRRSFEKADVSYHVACSDDDGIVGFASGGPIREDGFEQENELYAIYVLSPYHGRKIGSSLFRRIARDMQRSGRKGLLTFVLGINPNRTFYKLLGGREIAVDPIELGGATVDQVAYVWDDIGTLTRDTL